MLNLWQKNGVFKIEIIQPLLDMAAGSSNAAPGADSVANNEGEAPRVGERGEGCVFPSTGRPGLFLAAGFFHKKETCTYTVEGTGYFPVAIHSENTGFPGLGTAQTLVPRPVCVSLCETGPKVTSVKKLNAT